MMDITTGVITFIGTLNAVPGNMCSVSMGTCVGNVVRNLYIGPDQQLYGAALPLMMDSDTSYLYKIDTNTAAATVVCPFSAFGLLPHSVNMGISSTGVTYWKVSGPTNFGQVRRINLSTCAITVHISTSFHASASTLYFDTLYFINGTGRLLTNTPPSTTLVDTGFDTGILYSGAIVVGMGGDAIDCTTNDACWAPTTFFPYINSAYETDLRVAPGTTDHTSQPFSILYETNGTTSLFLNRSITGTGQVVYGAASTCYHNISVNIPPLAKRDDDMVYAGSGIMYVAMPIPPARGGGSLLMLYDRAIMTMLPVGRISETENITKLMMSPGGQLYALGASRILYTVTGTTLSAVCSLPVEVSAVFGFHGPSTTLLVQNSVTGTIDVMSPTTCALNPSPIATFTCAGGAAAVVNDVLYCVTTSSVTSITFGGTVTAVGTHSVTPLADVPHVFGFCHGGGSTLTMYHGRKFYDISTTTGALSNEQDFDLGTAPYEWYPSSSVWCA